MQMLRVSATFRALSFAWMSGCINISFRVPSLREKRQEIISKASVTVYRQSASLAILTIRTIHRALMRQLSQDYCAEPVRTGIDYMKRLQIFTLAEAQST